MRNVGRILQMLMAACLGLLVTACEATAPEGQVRTRQGAVQGVATRVDGVTAWLGIPYAAPPVGTSRWRAPGAAPAWDGVRAGDRHGNRCVQTEPFPDMIWNSAVESEDCLYLSVWAPDGAAGLPVMVWIHGGGFFSGSGKIVARQIQLEISDDVGVEGIIEDADHLNELGWWDPAQMVCGESESDLKKRIHHFYLNVSKKLP